MATNSTTAKEVKFNRANKDYDMYLNGRYVGSCGSHGEATAELDRLAHAELTH
jgi:hypothetical protein